MDRIKIFLVEDEMVIRNGIKNGIEWEKEGYKFAGEASDGELAYPMILKEKPDILLTDIRMPFMDGLELSRLVKEEFPDIKIILLSGYDEFDYAKEAIKLGATEYLLKPVSASELLNVLRKVADSVRQEKEEKELLKKYLEDMKENVEHEKMKFFGRLISGELSTVDAISAGKQYDMNLSACVYRIMLFKFYYTMNAKRQLGSIIKASEELESMTAKVPYVHSFQRGADGWAFLLTADDEGQMQQRTERFSRRIQEMMDNFKELEYFGGIGSMVERIGKLPESFADADYAFSERFIGALNRIAQSNEMKSQQGLSSFEVHNFGEIEQTRNSVEKFLNNGSTEEIDRFVEVYVGEISAENFKSILMRQYLIMDIYIVIMSFYEKMNVSDEDFSKEADSFKNAIQKIHTLEEVSEYMKEILRRVLDIRDTVSGRRYSDIIKAAQEIINRDYMTEEISLGTVATKIGMSPSYFSSVFSKEMGKTFVEYLTGIRMDKAKELLMCSSLKTSEVGYEVGYKDAHYFSYIFKKTQGYSPKEYRARRSGR